MTTCPVPVDVKGIRSRPSTCGCQRRLTRTSRTVRKVSRLRSHTARRTVASGTPPDRHEWACRRQPNDRGANLARHGGGQLNAILVDDDWDQILPVRSRHTRWPRDRRGPREARRTARRSNHDSGRTSSVGFPSQERGRTSLRQRHRQQLSTGSRDSKHRQGKRARKGSLNNAVSKIKFASG